MRFRLLLLDANIIIELFRLGIWEAFIARCDVHLSETVISESRFYEDDDGQQITIHMQTYRESGQITVHDVPASRLEVLRGKLGKTVLEKMDPGEAEILCVLDDASLGDDYHICSADGIVFRYLGASFRSHQALSLEEILGTIGLTKPLLPMFCRPFRDRYIKMGNTEGITGQAFRP